MKRLVSGLLLCVMILPGGPPASGQDDLWQRQWEQARTASVRVHHERGEPVAAPRLRQLEAEVQRLATRLGLTEVQRASLRTEPIEYLYLRDSSSLQWFGVDDVDGMALVRERRILASRLPHEHELVHVLAHIAISPAPGHNQPWLQEGLASYLGGHLGQSPDAVLALGDAVLDRNPGLIARILTVSGFRDSPLPAEECYAAAARFLDYLDRERGGMGPILQLLRLMSGFEEEVTGRPAAFVEVQLEGVYETGFAELLAAFEVWRSAHPVAGIVPSPIPQRMPDLSLEDDDHLVHWWHDRAGWVISVTPKQEAIDAALLWGSRAPGEGAWASPGRSSGYELRITEDGGRLIEHGTPRVLLRWFDGRELRGERGQVAWFFPAAWLSGIQPPVASSEATLWSQPRFMVD